MKEGTYYSRNRDRILNKRNLLYKKDSEFRARHKSAVKKYKQRKARERKSRKEQLKQYKKVWKELSIDGVVTPCCRLGYLAKSIGRSNDRLRYWERQRFLPMTVVYNSQRYYPQYHYNLIVREWQSRRSLSSFFDNIWKDWEEVKEQWIKKQK